MDVFLTIKNNQINFFVENLSNNNNNNVSLSHKKIKVLDFEQACAVLTIGLLMVNTAYACFCGRDKLSIEEHLLAGG